MKATIINSKSLFRLTPLRYSVVMFKKGLITLCISVMLLSVCASCSRWFDAYSDYDIGMFINGVEYHDRSQGLFSQPIRCGFFAEKRIDTRIMYICGGYRDLGPRFIIHGNDIYGFSFFMCVDSLQFDAYTKYFFKGKEIPSGELYQVFKKGEDISEPLLCGSIINRANKREYIIKEGWLLLGDYYYEDNEDNEDSDYYFFNCAQFEFYAESEDGRGITVTKGYCKNTR